MGASTNTPSLVGWGVQGLPYLLAGKPFLPPILSFLVTDRCTLRCRHCFNWRGADRGETAGAEGPAGPIAPDDPRRPRIVPGAPLTGAGLERRPDLDLDEIERISRGLGSRLYLILAGGEPFVRPDLPEIVSAFYRNSGAFNVIILTDGQLTDKIRVNTQRILEACPELYLIIGMSIDGLEAVHDHIRGRQGAFARAVQTFRDLQALQKRCDRLDLQTCSVFMRDNQESFDDLLDFIRDELKPDKTTVNLIRQRPRDPSLLDVSIDRYEAVARRLRLETFRGDIKNKYRHGSSWLVTLVDILMHDLIIRTIRTNTRQLVCRAGNVSGVLHHDGRMGPCEILPAWGNLRDVDYRPGAIWDSPAASAVRKEIRAGCFCTHEIGCYLPSIPWNPKHYPAIARLGYEWKKTAGWKDVN